MTKLVLLLAMWPFHHKKPAFVPDGICLGCDGKPGSPIFNITAFSDQYEIYHDGSWLPVTADDVVESIVDRDCAIQGSLWFYAGDDHFIGISGASCVDAKKDYESLHLDPVRMSRT